MQGFTVAQGMEDNIPGLLELLYADASMASGDSDLQSEAYHNFCKRLDALEGILVDKGVIRPKGDSNGFL